MYMRVTRSRIDPSRIDEVAAKAAQDVQAVIKRLPGNQSLLGGLDRASGRGITVSTWDTEEHARWSPDALGDVVSTLQALGAQIDSPEIFEVTTQA